MGSFGALALAAGLLAACSSSGAVSTLPSAGGSSGAAAPGSGVATGTPSAAGSAKAGALDSTVVLGQANAKVTVDVYDDYRCPICQGVDTAVGPVLQRDTANGSIRVAYHPVALIDGNDGGSGSLRAGNAAACANRAGQFLAYRAALFAAQPAETDDEFASDQLLIRIARRVTGLDSAAFEACVTSEPYAASVKSNLAKLTDQLKAQGTPAFFVDGEQWNVPSSTGDSLTSPDAQQAIAASLQQTLTAASGS